MSIAAKVEIPEKIMLSLRVPAEAIGSEIKQALALRYYVERRLSLGQCAELADMNEKSFISYLSRFGVSIFSFDSEEELTEDICNA
ncbi:MAG: UPF0175 family protein [Defluviitaleaceae bacterium]|nr:UPF0175 family protein [Defluviitaleaceae bacterium]